MKPPIVELTDPTRMGAGGSDGGLAGRLDGELPAELLGITPAPAPLPPALQRSSSAARASERLQLDGALSSPRGGHAEPCSSAWNTAPRPRNSADFFSIDRSVSARPRFGQRNERFLSESGLAMADLQICG
jgi:hypothetical protein